MKKLSQNNINISAYAYVVITLILVIMIVINAIDIELLQRENDKLENKIRYVETMNSLYEYNISQLEEFEPEDVNKDGVVDISDIALIRNYMLKEK